MLEYSLIKKKGIFMQNIDKEYVVKQIETLDKDLSRNNLLKYLTVFSTGICLLITKVSYEALNSITVSGDLSFETILDYLGAVVTILSTLGFGFLTIDGILSTIEIAAEIAVLNEQKRKLERILEQVQEKEQTSDLTR